MIDYEEPKANFGFHPEEAELMLYAATGGDVTQLSMESQEDFDILINCFSEWVLENS
jgi:hypothetical protein